MKSMTVFITAVILLLVSPLLFGQNGTYIAVGDCSACESELRQAYKEIRELRDEVRKMHQDIKNAWELAGKLHKLAYPNQ